MNNPQKRQDNFLDLMMRLYILYTITHRSDPKLNKEIKCEKCGSCEHLELHHIKYIPEEIYVDDIQLLCPKCHRNSKVSKHKSSQVRTVFENGKRFCELREFKFEY